MTVKHPKPDSAEKTLSMTIAAEQGCTKSAYSSAVLTTSEAAAYLSIQPTTLEQWRWNGKSPRFVKIGRSVRYRITDLDAFLAERVYTSTTEAQAAL